MASNKPCHHWGPASTLRTRAYDLQILFETESPLPSIVSMDRRRGEKNQSQQSETCRLLVEFLEVAINSIVFLKRVYPPEAFERSRYMNVVVQRARHPQLRDYIHSATFSLYPFMQKGLVERVAVIFYNKEHIPSERFIFKLSLNQSYGSKVESNGLEFALRSFLIKLSVAEPLTRALPPDCRWEITAYFHSLPPGSSKETQLWIPTDTKQWQQPPLITPIKSMSSEPLSVQLYLEHPSVFESTDPSG